MKRFEVLRLVTRVFNEADGGGCASCFYGLVDAFWDEFKEETGFKSKDGLVAWAKSFWDASH